MSFIINPFIFSYDASGDFVSASMQGSWSWFSDPRALSINGHPAVGAVNNSGDVIVYPVTSESPSAVSLKSALEADDHIVPSFLRRNSDGRIIAWYTAHNGAAFYQRISTNPDDPSFWGAEVNLDSQFGLTGYTYSNPAQLTGEANSPIYLFFRAELSGQRAFWYSKSVDEGATWGAPIRLLAGTYRYIRIVQNGNGRIDVCIAPHPNPSTSGTSEGSLYHIYYEGGYWQEIGGSSLTLPITPTTSLTPIWNGATVGNGQAWVWDIARDANGYPVIAYVVYPEGSTENPRYRYARWNGTAWIDNEVCGGGGQLMLHASLEPYYNSGICFDHSDPDIVYCVQRYVERFVLLRAVTADNGASWSFTQITENTNAGEQLFRPIIVRGQATEPRLAYLDGLYDEGGSAGTTGTTIRLINSGATATPAPSASPPMAVVRRRLRAGTGKQQFVVPGFGTPKAARFVLSSTLEDGVVRDGVYFSVGATDGVNQYVVASVAAHNAGTTNTKSRAATDEVVMIIDANGSIIVEANFDAWVTDGVSINITAHPGGGQYYVTVVLFGGDDLTAKVGTTALATQNNSVTVTPNFETSALFLDSHQRSFNDASAGTTILSMGLASFDGAAIRQCAQLWRLDTGTGAATTQGELSTSRLAAFLDSRYAELHSITSTAFQLKSLGGNLSTTAVGYLAISLAGGHEAWAGVLDSPTTTGEHDLVGPSFTPVFGTIVPNMFAAADVTKTDGTAGVQGVAVFTVDGEYCTSWADETAADPTDNQIVSTATAIDLYDHAGVASHKAGFVAFVAGGATLDFSIADATARKWPTLFIG